MNGSVTIFAMGPKGQFTLKEIIGKFGGGVIDKVIYGTDKAVVNDYSNNIIDLCKDASIPYYHRSEDFTVDTDYCIALSWRWLIESTSKSKLIVFHDSLLPKYRGFAPLVNTLINGEKEIGVTALFADKDYDCGDIISQKKISIQYPIKIKNAIDVLSHLYAELGIEVINTILESEKFIAKKQDNTKATYSLWRSEDDYLIDWTKDAVEIARFIDSVGYPFLGASSFIGGQKTRILDATPLMDMQINDRNRNLGKTIFIEDGCPIVVCGAGLLKIKEAIEDSSKLSIIPLKKFRTKFE